MLINYLHDFLAYAVLVGGQPIEGAQGAGQAAATAAAQAAETLAPQAVPSAAGFSPLIIVAYVAIFGALYFFTIRPQRKREKEMKTLQASLKPGDNIITSSGFYGRIVDVYDDNFVVEFGTNKGVRIPIRKSEIIGIKEPGNGLSSQPLSKDAIPKADK